MFSSRFLVVHQFTWSVSFLLIDAVFAVGLSQERFLASTADGEYRNSVEVQNLNYNIFINDKLYAKMNQIVVLECHLRDMPEKQWSLIMETVVKLKCNYERTMATACFLRIVNLAAIVYSKVLHKFHTKKKLEVEIPMKINDDRYHLHSSQDFGDEKGRFFRATALHTVLLAHRKQVCYTWPGHKTEQNLEHIITANMCRRKAFETKI